MISGNVRRVLKAVDAMEPGSVLRIDRDIMLELWRHMKATGMKVPAWSFERDEFVGGKLMVGSVEIKST